MPKQQKISSLENQLKLNKDSKAKRTARYGIVNNYYPTREEVSKQIKEEIDNATETRRLKDLLAEAKAKYNNLTQGITTLKASYDNLLDENTALKRKSVMMNDSEKLNEAKLIIDALQKENAELKAKISDREAHSTTNSVEIKAKYNELKDSYDKILKENVLMMAEKPNVEKIIEKEKERYSKLRSDNAKTINDLKADLLRLIYVSDRIDTSENDVTNKKFVIVDGIKYQVSVKLYQVFKKFVKDFKDLADEVNPSDNEYE